MEELLKAFMRSAAQQVYIVTARSGAKYVAFTASSVTSISLNPPLMAVSIAKASRNHDPLINAEYFLISLLGLDGEEAARMMAEQADPHDKLERVGCTETRWGPILDVASGYLALRRYAIYDGGDHTIVLGEVVGGEAMGSDCPLVYHNRRYTSILGCSRKPR